MRSPRSRSCPTRCRSSEPYVTARGTLKRREMVLLRLRTRTALVGLGEAVPLSLRGGVASGAGGRRAEAAGRADALDEATLRSRRRAVGPGTLRRARRRCWTCAGGARRGRLRSVARAPNATRQPVQCNATLVAGEPAAVAADARALGRGGFATFKLKLGAGDDVGQVRRGARGARAGGADPGRRQRRLGPGDGEADAAELEPLEIELAEQPVATLEERPSWPARPRSRSPATRASRRARMPSGRCEPAPATWPAIKLSKVGGPEEAIAIAEVLPSYLSSALDGPVGIAAAAQVAQTLAAAAGAGRSEPRPRPRHPAPLRLDHRRGRVRAARRHAPPAPGPGLGVEIDEEALAAHRL